MDRPGVVGHQSDPRYEPVDASDAASFPEPDQRRGQPLEEVSKSRARTHGLVASLSVDGVVRHGEARSLRRVDRLVPRIRLLLYDPWPIHSSPPT